MRLRWRALPKQVRRRWWWGLLLLLPVVLINVSVAMVGHSRVFPLSPFFLRNKVSALEAYSRHRPRCLLFTSDVVSPELVAGTETRHHLPCGLLGAVIQVESGGQAHRISSAGAMGPVQLIPSTANALGVSDPFDPEESLDGAARYLHSQHIRFHSLRLVAAAYNAGPGSILGHAVPHNGQTEIYVERVMYALALERRARCRPPRRTALSASTHPRPGPSLGHAAFDPKAPPP